MICAARRGAETGSGAGSARSRIGLGSNAHETQWGLGTRRRRGVRFVLWRVFFLGELAWVVRGLRAGEPRSLYSDARRASHRIHDDAPGPKCPFVLLATSVLYAELYTNLYKSLKLKVVSRLSLSFCIFIIV